MKSLLFGLLCAIVVMAGSMGAGVAPDPLLTVVGVGSAFAGILANQGQAAAAPFFYATQSAANTAAATTGWIDVRPYEGDIMFTIVTGAITGSLTPTFEDATDIGGTGNAAIVPNEGNPAVINTANQVRKCTINAGATRGFVRMIGTVATGPVLLGVALHAHPKYT